MPALEQLRADLVNFPSYRGRERSDCLKRAKEQSPSSRDQWLAMIAMLATTDFSRPDNPADAALLTILLESLWRSARQLTAGSPVDEESLGNLKRLYARLDRASRFRPHLLRILAACGQAGALALFAELLVTDPPPDMVDAAPAFVPLVQHPPADIASLFPRLLDGLEHATVAPLILDLANFLTRRELVQRHPAASHVDALANLLGGLVAGLQRLETQPRQTESATQREQRRQQVGQTLTLVVSLCDTLALIGEKRVAGKLHQAMSLGHRRIRTEAAAALARLGDEAGTETLIAMAAEPAVRTRALAYLEELGQLDRAREEDRTATARAAGQLADWLSQPAQFGIAPQSLELIDECRQYWPGYSDLVDCFLFEYSYDLGTQSFSGLALAGPVTHAMQADLADLPPSDIYAVFAGWHAEHEELAETASTDLDPAERVRWEESLKAAAGNAYANLELVKIGRFFGEDHPVATAVRGGLPGVLVLDGGQTHWQPIGPAQHPLGPTEVYYLHRGRKLLQAFNRATD